MGLLYLMPTKMAESDHIIFKPEGQLFLKSYGLPWIFWGYLAAALSVLFFMILAISTPIIKLSQSDALIDLFMAYGMAIFIPLLIIGLLAFYFTSKIIEKKKKDLTIAWEVFGIKILSRSFKLKESDSLYIQHYLETPNMARASNQEHLAAFQNKGYFELFAIDINNKKILVDRHSLKTELKKLQELLQGA